MQEFLEDYKELLELCLQFLVENNFEIPKPGTDHHVPQKFKGIDRGRKVQKTFVNESMD